MKAESSRPDLPHPTSATATFTQEDDGIHYTSDGVWSDGRTSKVSAVLELDGNWCPVTGSFLADSLSFRRLEDGSFETKMKKGGDEVGATRATVSADGRTLTGRWDFVGPDGAILTWNTTHERQ
jgi:hypothetical protein